MNNIETAFIYFCKILGADIFKKYWPTAGSYWNRKAGLKPAKSTNRGDLKRIIKQADGFTHDHVRQAIMEVILLLGTLVLGIQEQNYVLKIAVLILGVHVYAFMIHHYNRILARRKIRDLDATRHKEDDADEELCLPVRNRKADIDKSDDSEWLIITRGYLMVPNGYYKLYLLNFNSEIGPYLSESDVLDYKTFLKSKFRDEYELYLADYQDGKGVFNSWQTVKCREN